MLAVKTMHTGKTTHEEVLEVK